VVLVRLHLARSRARAFWLFVGHDAISLFDLFLLPGGRPTRFGLDVSFTDADGDEIPSASHAGGVGLAVRLIGSFANVDFPCIPPPPEGLMCHAVNTAKEKI
jgi:hypothetical protein